MPSARAPMATREGACAPRAKAAFSLREDQGGWRARYLKDVDGQETTLRFWQEIYDDAGRLVEVHEKFPVDKGHQKV